MPFRRGWDCPRTRPNTVGERVPGRRGARFVAIGDSFTEGVGDDLPDGTQRGWADLVALALATSGSSPSGHSPFPALAPTTPREAEDHWPVSRALPSDSAALTGVNHGVQYANLAIRGKLLAPIVAGQLEPALALSPTLLSVCGGGNDVMRPRVEIDAIISLLDEVAQRAAARGAHVLMLTGGNPTRHLPLGALIQRRGDRLAGACLDKFTRPGVTFVNNWLDDALAEREYWSSDRLHLNARGHTRVAANVLHAIGVPVPADWGTDGAAAAGAESAAGIGASAAAPVAARLRTERYYRTHVLPWIGRRLTGRSSGDGRTAKRPTLLPVERP